MKLVAAVLAAAALAAAALAAGAADAKKPLTPKQDRVQIRKAIKAEKQALKDLTAGNTKGAKAQLEKSRKSLAAAEPTSNGLGTAGADVRQAMNKDDIAIDELVKNPGRARGKINEAIVKKEGAIAQIKRATAKAPPPANKPPEVSQFEADFEWPTTHYAVTATDPEKFPLTYVWSKSNPCGDWEPNSPSSSEALWHHPDNDPGNPHPDPNACPNEPVHAATITVAISDGHWTCTVTYTGGSAPVAPFKPDAPCVKAG